MKKLSISFLLVGFILWILPLGHFIKPAQEKLACDGQRAMCMCYVMGHRSSDKPIDAGISFKAGTSTEKENSSGGGNYFVSARPLVILNVRLSSTFEDKYLSYNNPFITPLESVPKI